MKVKLRVLLPVLALGALVLALAGGAGAAGSCVGSACATAPTAPVVKTTAPSAITATSVTLTGTVNPGGSTSSCYFEYGTSAAYGERTPDQTVKPIAGSTTPQAIGAKVSGLQPRQTFHEQLLCTNATGPSSGGDTTFTTADHGPSQIRLSGHTGFVSSGGIAGVFIGCYGDRNCMGSLTITHNGAVIGQRSSYFIPANAGGIIHLPLSHGAMTQLRRDGKITVSVASKTTDGQQLMGGDSGLTLTLHIFR